MVLEFCKQRLYLFSFPLEVGKGRSASQFASMLPGGFVDVDGRWVPVWQGTINRAALEFVR